MAKAAYNKEKIEAFKIAFEEFQKKKQEFKTEMSNFRNTMDFIRDTANTHTATNDSEYVINSDGIMMSKNGINEQNYTKNYIKNTVNTIHSENVFFSSKKYNDRVSVPINETNKLYQVGLDDLTFDNSKEKSRLRRYINLPDNLTPDNSNGSPCNESNFSKCSSKAKMENKSYYGLRGNSGGCECYIFDTLDGTSDVQQTVNTIVVDNNANTAYLAILMDGNFYKLREQVYSNNYENFYNPTTIDKMISFPTDDGYKNPFTGNGINRINISTIGSNCAIKL